MKQGTWYEKVALIAMSVMMVLALVPANAYAKTRTVNVSTASQYSSGAAPSGSKRVYTGTSKVTLRKGGGVVYFKAPKTKTYTISVSNMRAKKGRFAMVAFKLYDKRGTYQFDELYGRIKSRKGAIANDHCFALTISGRKISWPRYMDCAAPKKSATIKVRLKKGEVLRVDFDNPKTNVVNGKKVTLRTKATLKIS